MRQRTSPYSKKLLALTVSLLLLVPIARAADEAKPVTDQEIKAADEKIAAELANPLSPVTTFATQFRTKFGNGPDNDVNYQLRLQPSFFEPIGDKSAFLLRTIVPVLFQNWPTSDSGLGDITLTPYYVPDVTKSVFFGFGGALGLPTATADALGSQKWTAGPAMIVAVAGQPLTYGMMLQQVWSYAETSGDDGPISVLTGQPFITYLLGGGYAGTFTCEASYDWHADTDPWLVPLALALSKVVDIGGKFVNFGVGGVYYAARPDGAPEAEIRLNATYVFR